MHGQPGGCSPVCQIRQTRGEENDLQGWLEANRGSGRGGQSYNLRRDHFQLWTPGLAWRNEQNLDGQREEEDP